MRLTFLDELAEKIRNSTEYIFSGHTKTSLDSKTRANLGPIRYTHVIGMNLLETQTFYERVSNQNILILSLFSMSISESQKVISMVH